MPGFTPIATYAVVRTHRERAERRDDGATGLVRAALV
jgi:hypothetical protein